MHRAANIYYRAIWLVEDLQVVARTGHRGFVGAVAAYRGNTGEHLPGLYHHSVDTKPKVALISHYQIDFSDYREV